jgi:hypothetical protein
MVREFLQDGWRLIKETAPVWLVVAAGAVLIWASTGGASCAH